MEPADVKQWLWDKGYVWSGPEGYTRFDQVSSFDLNDSVFFSALKRCHEFNGQQLNYLTERLYMKPHEVTGKFGHATEQLMRLPRCPLPDFTPPPNVKLSYTDADLQSAVQSMQAVGSGSWTMPCQKEGVTFSVDTRLQPREMREFWAAIISDVVKDYAEQGIKLVEVPPGEWANIRISWEDLNRIGRGVIGLAEFNNESCGDSVFCKMSPDYYPDNAQIRQLLEHEMGHNMNLPHTQGGIMNSFITDGWVGFTPNDPSVPRLKRYFGGEPIDQPPEPEPEPPPDPDPDPDPSPEPRWPFCRRMKLGMNLTLNGKRIGKFSIEPFVDL